MQQKGCVTTMKIETLKDRIKNAESKIEKKSNTIVKKKSIDWKEGSENQNTWI